MAKRPTRLRFTEDDLADSHVKKAADRADKAVDKAEKAADKLASKKAKPKLKLETDAAGSRKAKLRFEKAEFTEIERPSVAKHMASRGAAVTLTSKAHQAVSEYEDDNIGVQAVQETTKAVESTAYTVDHAVYSHKLKAYDKAEKLVEKSDKANVNALYEKFKKDNPDAASNPISRWKQKQAIKKEYAAAKASKGTAKETAAKATKKAAQSTKTITEKAMEFCTTHSKTILFVLIAELLFMILSGMFSSCSAMFQGGTQIVLGTSFTAKEEDIIGADNDYKALEAALRNEINNIERTHSGYDEYRYDLDEINHNPYELAAYLTVKFEDYTRSEVQGTLQSLFDQQYELTLTEEVEIRTRTETRTGTSTWTDPETGETYEEEYEYEVEVEYEYYILNVKLENKGLNRVIGSSGMSEDEMERYAVLLQTNGNRPDIFGDDIYAVTGEYTDYDIPGEALTDTRFANMIREAEKYLGYPYVWGGSSPSTSFDCSGFVSYVINNCGNGWSVGRLTANGLMGVCDIIPRSSAKPGDLIFFQGTYDTSGASHVGIYVGDGMMIHCGNPISYASIESNYWQQHFYCFGRIRN
ncbi:NlpC/P60 family protein [Blautia coccoides]|uniref:C40 family peptidase n=1 Tax=Blautia producta TaxID=33035 RepID=UPI00210C79B5|nr:MULTISPECIES: C40 family peptidase [Blautia]MCQ5125301.1 NlpC/P60 family protein [Blautia producta]MDT4377213.1 NlpC/P60 family protein [Blautia coccoides]